MKNNMRIQLVPNLKLEQKQKYNSTQEKYLKILSSSYEELHQYILDKASTNPLIEYNSSLDPDLLLEFDRDIIEKEGYSLITPVVITNADNY